MKSRRFLLWRWCPRPEHMKATRTRPVDRAWMSLLASGLLLSLLAIQGIQLWVPPTVSAGYPNNYSPLPPVEPPSELPAATTSPSQLMSRVSTGHLDVQLEFPESAEPGQTVTILATTTANSNVKVVSMSIDIFSYANNQLVKSASETVLKDKRVHSGDTWQTSLAVVVPTTAQRSVMIGTITELWEETTSYYAPYYYAPYFYRTYYPYDPPDIYDHPLYYYISQPAYLVTQKSLQQTIPLTYVLATTPEYEELLNRHEQLSRDYDELLSKHNELSSKYESLRADYDQTVAKYNQLQGDYNSTTQELANFRLYTYVLIVVLVSLGMALTFILAWRRGKTGSQDRQQQMSESTQRRNK